MPRLRNHAGYAEHRIVAGQPEEPGAQPVHAAAEPADREAVNATTPALHPFAPVVAAITIPADAFYVGDVISIGGRRRVQRDVENYRCRTNDA